MKKAILFGASGFIGTFLLEELLNSVDYEQVTIVVRKPLNVNHPKLKMLLGDYKSLPDLSAVMVADEIFIALGTTLKNTPDKAEYYQVDHDYPVLASKMMKEKGASAVFIVSAIGADAKSKIAYLKTKGEMELDIILLDFEHTHIFRPSMLMGNRKEHRPFEKSFMKIWSVLGRVFIGRLNKYRGIEGKDVAKAMVHAAKHPSEKIKYYYWEEMHKI